MSMMAIMDMMVMSEASNESAKSTESPSRRRQPHRQYEIPWKRRVVEETFAPGTSVSIVARRHDVIANMVFDWRKKYRQGTLVERKAAAFPGHDLIRVGEIDHNGGIRPLPAVNGYPVPPPSKPRKVTAVPEGSRWGCMPCSRRNVSADDGVKRVEH